MLSITPGTGFFVQVLDESSEQILHLAVVQGFTDEIYTAELQEDAALLERGQDLFVCYEAKGRFICHPARVDVIADPPSERTFSFQFTGDAVPADRRQCFRVSTVTAAVTATFGGEKDCPVVDVSATGYGVVATKQYKAMDIVTTTLRFEDQTLSGQGRIQSVRDVGAGRIRYGLLCVNGKSPDETLFKGLQQISAAIQRQHLRHLSRAG